jgi:tetratricopeptide (TPR) repeat protein
MKRQLLLLFVSFSVFAAHSQTDTLTQEVYNASVEAYNLGLDAFYSKDYKQALPQLRLSAQLNPNFADVWYALSSTQNALGQLDSALFHINMAISLEAEQPDYALQRANIYYKQEKYQRAVADYSNALKYNATAEVEIMEDHVFFNRGNCYLYLQEYAKARADFDKAIALGYDVASVFHNRATALLRLDLKSDACKDFRKAVELGSKISGKYIDKYCK